MLRQMCQSVLSEADVRAICKARGLPDHAASSRSLLESYFLSDTGVAVALAAIDRTEIALLHLLKAVGKPVGVAFFSPLNPPEKRKDGWSYGTFTQRFQGLFSTVKERLVRRGILILALGPETYEKKTNMERWQFALPLQLERQLPPLVESVKRLDGEGSWRSDVAREKLKTVAGRGTAGETDEDKLGIVACELRFGGKPFGAERLLAWQKRRWQAETALEKSRKSDAPFCLLPCEAVVHILSGLDAGLWADVDALAEPLLVFCGFNADSRSVCESGWRWGCVARQEFDGKTWYRLPPPPPTIDSPPHEYLAVMDKSIAVDLNAVGFETLEKLVMISDQRAAPAGRAALLITPNLVKLGRAAETILALPLVDWLQKNSPVFRQAFETLRQRRGKTILHENLSVARVRDLALKIALEKALGGRIVSLGDDSIAFPKEAVGEVKRVVTKLGHVVKEASHRGT
jgi:hypothetical protein